MFLLSISAKTNYQNLKSQTLELRLPKRLSGTTTLLEPVEVGEWP